MNYEIKRHNGHFVLEKPDDLEFYTDIINEQTPCDGCVHKQACKEKRLACYAFALYVNDGRVDWSVPRKPTRRIYSRAMRIGSGESTLIREINKLMRERVLA
jgi:hypothetical protein